MLTVVMSQGDNAIPIVDGSSVTARSADTMVWSSMTGDLHVAGIPSHGKLVPVNQQTPFQVEPSVEYQLFHVAVVSNMELCMVMRSS